MAIERKFIQQNMREFRIKRFVEENVSRVGLAGVQIKKTPLGDKIVIHASRPGLVVGRGGANIQELTRKLKAEFDLDNPQIEIEEVAQPDLDAHIVAERIVNSLERFGSGRTKGIGHRTMKDSMDRGALGIEIIISGKIPSMRARSWRFYSGYLKKAGDLAVEGVRHSIKSVTLKSGAVGVKVSIMPPDLQLPDSIKLLDVPVTEVTDVTGDDIAAEAEEAAEKAQTKQVEVSGGEQKDPQTAPKGKVKQAKASEAKGSGVEKAK
jgi:small subunit ribosomal protein S3